VNAASPINKQCPMQNACFSMNIPDASASASNDVFIQMTGPTSLSWIGIGTGSQMSGSNMLIIYTSSNGNNVTLSARKGNGHSAPSPSSDMKVSLLDGSGVSNGVMTANIRCW
jgi:cellobiose dehydrogenase-like cytochrome